MKWNAVEHVAWNPKKGKDPVLFLLFTSFHVHLDSILNTSKIFQHEKKTPGICSLPIFSEVTPRGEDSGLERYDGGPPEIKSFKTPYLTSGGMTGRLGP